MSDDLVHEIVWYLATKGYLGAYHIAEVEEDVKFHLETMRKNED